MKSPEIVDSALGYGGASTNRFINEEILTRFGNSTLNKMEDGSWIDLGNSSLVITTDSYIVTPLFFPGGDIGRIAVCGTVNDLVASGSRPRFLTLSLVLAEGLPIDDLKQILDSIKLSADQAKVQIVAGDTKVVDKAGELALCINTAGIGVPVWPSRRYSLADSKPGDSIIVTGTMGDHGLAVLSEREGLGFETRVSSDAAPLQDLILPLIEKFDGIRSLRDPTRSGLIGVAHDLADATGLDICLYREKIPVQKEVDFGCEMLGLDPLGMTNEGKMVLTVASNQAEEVLTSIRNQPLGKNAAIVGRINHSSGNIGHVLLSQADGSIKLVFREEGPPIPRLC